jgi:acyl carrier protein
LPISAIPLTQSGKVDRRGLPKPEIASSLAPNFSDPDPERMVALIVRNALGGIILSSTESLSARGLDSLGMAGILAGIEDAFGIAFGETDITPDLFQSVASLIRFVTRRLVEDAS